MRQAMDATRLLRVDGVFDVAAAERVARALAEEPADAPVEVDLTHVRELHDFGVAFLAQALADRPCAVRIHGLRQHHVRLLRYLGIEADAVHAPA
jgi:STAS domain